MENKLKWIALALFCAFAIYRAHAVILLGDYATGTLEGISNAILVPIGFASTIALVSGGIIGFIFLCLHALMFLYNNKRG